MKKLSYKFFDLRIETEGDTTIHKSKRVYINDLNKKEEIITSFLLHTGYEFAA